MKFFSNIFIFWMYMITNCEASKEDYRMISICGLGGSGSVHLVQHIKSKKNYAMKIIKKHFIHQNNLYAQIQTERDILATNRSPYTMRLYESFFDEEYLYFITPYTPGGDLMSLIMTYDTFTQDMTRFYIAEILLGLEYLHEKEIILRDLKFENILVDISGHLIITDFGLAATSSKYDDNYFSDLIETEKLQYQRRLSGTFSPLGRSSSKRNQRPGMGSHKRSQTLIPTIHHPPKKHILHQRKYKSKLGTMSYISQSVLRGSYTNACDLWSLGIIMYEALFGHPPFDGQTDAETFKNIMNYKGTLDFPTYDGGFHIDNNAKDLMNMLVCFEKDASTISDIKKHPFFNGVDWTTIRTWQPPFVPTLVDGFDMRYFPVQELLQQHEQTQQHTTSYATFIDEGDAAFENFSYQSFL